jgi:hypothetical protein
VAPDSTTANKLVQFAQYQFNLSELYARRLRQKIYENKATFSDISFLKPLYETIEKILLQKMVVLQKKQI